MGADHGKKQEKMFILAAQVVSGERPGTLPPREREKESKREQQLFF